MSVKILFAVLLPITAAACASGCSSAGGGDESWRAGPATRVRCSVFEVAAADADAAVATGHRRRVPESAYEVAVLPAEAAEGLRRLTRPDSGSLTDNAVIVNAWPRGAADSYSYSRADEKVLGSGTGTGFLGVRDKDGARELRADYHVTHGVNRAGPVDPAAWIDSRLFFEGKVADGQAVVFLAPFERSDGTRVAHVVAFVVGEAK